MTDTQSRQSQTLHKCFPPTTQHNQYKSRTSISSQKNTTLFESYITQSWGISAAAAPEKWEAMFPQQRKQLLFNHIHRVQLINLYPQSQSLFRTILRHELWQSRIVAEEGEIKPSVMKQLILVNGTSYKLQDI